MEKREEDREVKRPSWFSGYIDKAIQTSFLSFSLFSIFTFFLSILLGALLYFSTEEGVAASGRELPGLPVMLLLVFQAYLPIKATAGSIFVLLLSLFILCMLIAWAGPQESLQKVLKRKNLRLSDLSRNWLLSLPLLGSLLLSAEVMLTLLQDALGFPSGSITITNRLEFLLDLSYAAVVEEIGFRLSPLGATTAILMALEATFSPKPEGRVQRGIDPLFLAFFYPDGAKKRASLRNVAEDGWLRGIHIIEFLVSLYSAIAFGMAHYVFGAGWGIGKVTTSSIVGFALALVYLRYGIEASILTHWYFNYYLYVFEIAPEFYPSLNPLATLIGILILFFGTVLLVDLGFLLGKKLLRRRGLTENA